MEDIISKVRALFLVELEIVKLKVWIGGLKEVLCPCRGCLWAGCTEADDAWVSVMW